MNLDRLKRLLALAAVAGLVVVLPVASTSVCFGDDESGGAAETPQPAAQPAESAPAETAEAPKAPAAEPTRVEGTIYKIDPEGRIIGILIPPSGGHRAYRKIKLVMDGNSLVLVGGQPSNLDALAQGQKVQAGYFKKGKQEIIDTIVVVPE